MKDIFLLLLSLSIISCNPVSTKTKTIGIQGFGNVDKYLTDTIKQTILDVYDFDEVIILKNKPLPKSAFINIKSPRYRADSILKVLKREIPDSIDYIIGVTNKDISTTKRDRDGNILKPENKYTDWGIFGLGYRPGVSCVVSTYRIKSAGRKKFITRLKKICMHEIGHNLGLKHCTHDNKCVMRDAAETIKTVDNVDLKLYSYCSSLVGE
ncbi:matrixin family metalloprotease [Bernardetia sp.]|uniref:matrixin family metalloprotease n=1 Tax=Bernardetia sp. TaxID=1937974 RepID=UPI0025BA1541|nr:matrixin family metalloprotease [Bernardetia sp.]